MSVQISAKKQFLLGILLICIILFVAEISGKIWINVVYICEFQKSDAGKLLDKNVSKNICRDSLDIFTFWSRDNGLINEPNQKFRTININTDGFRGSEINDKLDDTYRIMMVGGSTTFGGLSDEQTIPAYIQKILNKESEIQVEVINAGVNSAWSTTEYQLIKNKLIKYQPDLIIVYDGWNDINVPLSVQLQSMEELEINTNLETIKKIFKFFRTDVSQIDSPLILYQIGKSFKSFLSIDSLNIDNQVNDMSKISSIWMERSKNICELGDKNNFKVIVSIQPFLGTSDRKLSVSEMKLFESTQLSKIVNEYKVFENKLIELEPFCDKTLNLTDAFDGINKPIFYDEVHIADQGNQIIAKKISKLILKTITE
jgi:hypothetical protein